jgi:hypothetical protein
MAKTHYISIRCEGVDLEFLSAIGRNISSFPYTYFGLPLNTKKPSRASLMPVVQKVGAGYQGGKRLLSYPGRELLGKTILTAIPTYYLTAFKFLKWIFAGINKFRRNFFWKGSNPDNVKGVHCLVSWRTCQRPSRLGGVGINDLEKFNRALRLRWPWYNWDPEERHWKKLFRLDDPTNRSLLFASTYVIIGDGKATPFWEAKWLHGAAPKDIAPELFEATWFKKRSVHCELKNNNWIRRLRKIDTSAKLDEYVLLFLAISSVALSDNKDEIIWR